MELNHGDGVPVWWRTGGGPEVGQELKGSKAVRLSTLAGWGGQEGRSPRQIEVAAERLMTTVVLR
jgi:hypothetical protein